MKYRLPELDVPDDNPFQHDALDRKPVVEFLSGLIRRLSGPFVLALDSPWGTGKTTLIRMLQADLKRQEFQCLYFNAWKVDYVTDPLVALVGALDDLHLDDDDAEKSFRGHLKIAKEITTMVAKRVVVAGVKAATLNILDMDKAIEAMASENSGAIAGDLVDAFNKEKVTLETFKSEVEKAVKTFEPTGKKENLVFFIDELDRCRPTFAIEMLERIKHLFDVPNIIFVLSVDKGQLEASTAAVYGDRINAQEYLRRFIDLEYGIPLVQTKKFTEKLLTRFELDSLFSERKNEVTRYDKDNFVDAFTVLADHLNMSLRARERCITRLCIVMEQTQADHFLDPFLVALLLVLRSNKADLFIRICSGVDGPEAVMQYLSGLPGGAQLVDGRLGVLLEAYLIASDPNGERREARNSKLRRQAEGKDAADARPQTGQRALKLLDMQHGIFSGFRETVSLKTVAGKIDLAALVKD